MRPITIRIKKRKLQALKMLTVGVALLLVVMMLDSRVRPMIQTMAAYQAQLLATRAINDAVMNVISEEEVVYNTIIDIAHGNDGDVASISTDMITMNRLKAQITNKVTDYLMQNPKDTLYIPAGTLLGSDLLSGRGPDVEIKVLPVGSVHSEIYNNFSAAGINQTLHQIMLSIEADISAVMPFYTVKTKVHTNICIAETIIVGKVPASYTDINGDMSDLLDQFNNYQSDLTPDGISAS